MKKIIAVLAILFSVVAACNQKKPVKTAGNIPENSLKYTCSMHPQVIKDEPGNCPICGMKLVPLQKQTSVSNAIELSDEQIKLAGITLQKIKPGAGAEGGVINGVLKANEFDVNQISSRAAGRIEKLFVKQTGEKITKGDPVYKLYSEELQALQSEYLLAYRQYNELGKDNSRYKSFLESAEKKLLLYGLQKSQIEALKKTKKITASVMFYSPFSGVVAEIGTAEGQYLPEGGMIYQLKNLSQLWIEGEVYPDEVKNIKPGTTLRVLVNGFENEPVRSKVIEINPATENGSQLVLIRALLDNPDLKFQPGMQAQIVLNEIDGKNIFVPQKAIIRDESGAFVFVRKEKNVFEPRKVKPGIESANQVEIVNGLKTGEVIAATGAYLIYSEMVLNKGADPMSGMKMNQ